MDHDRPYKAIINISFSIYPVDATGELSGHCVHRAQLKESGLKHKILEVSGKTYQECVDSLKQTMDRILQCNQ
jgi:hypothetical protein